MRLGFFVRFVLLTSILALLGACDSGGGSGGKTDTGPDVESDAGGDIGVLDTIIPTDTQIPEDVTPGSGQTTTVSGSTTQR